MIALLIDAHVLRQALLLWLPLSIWPPLARRLKIANLSWYLLEVPCLKFCACFFVDLLFFISLTALSQWRTAPLLHQQMIDTFGLYGVVWAHLVWVSAILVNEVDQHLSSKSAEVLLLRGRFEPWLELCQKSRLVMMPSRRLLCHSLQTFERRSRR